MSTKMKPIQSRVVVTAATGCVDATNRARTLAYVSGNNCIGISKRNCTFPQMFKEQYALKYLNTFLILVLGSCGLGTWDVICRLQFDSLSSGDDELLIDVNIVNKFNTHTK